MLKIASNLSLPLEAATQTIAILARRGAGKTYCAKVIAEEMLAAKIPIVMIDPIGVLHGLRSHFSIAILGGKNGDIPLEPTGGKAIAEFVVAERSPIILDVSAFGENEMRRFVGEFCDKLYRTNSEPLHLFVDEADEFAAQNPYGAEGAKCLSAMQNIVRRGRARGLGATLITQRSAVLSKSVLTQTECLIAMQTTGPQDLAAIEAWVKYHGTDEQRREIMASLPTLQQGEGWVYSPGWLKILKRVKFRTLKSLDTSVTPKVGEKRPELRAMREVDLKALTSKMAATIERAKADDPRELKKRIGELERELKASAKGKPQEIPAATVDGIRESAEHQGRQMILIPITSAFSESIFCLAKISKLADEMQQQLTAVFAKVSSTPAKPKDRKPEIPATPTRRVVPQAPPAEGMSGVSQRILNSLAELEQLGADTPARELAAFLAGYSNLKSTGFVKAIGELRTAGHVVYPSSDSVSLTDSGRSLARPPAAPTSAMDVQSRIVGMLGGAAARILQPLIDAYPKSMARADVADRAGYGNLKSTGFVKAISRLRSLGFVDYPDSVSARAKPVLFLES